MPSQASLDHLGAAAKAVYGIVGRLGGEEFAILARGGTAEALKHAGALQRSIRARRFDHDGETFAVTCSFGIAEWSDGETIDQLLRRADVAMYQAKRSGRDRIVTVDAFAPTKEHDTWRGVARTGAARE